MDPAHTFQSAVACPASIEITPLTPYHWSDAHEGSLHTASAIYTYPPYFPTGQGQVASTAKQFRPDPHSCFSIWHASSASASLSQTDARIKLHIATVLKGDEETFMRQATVFRFLRIPRHPTNEMTQPFAFRLATLLSSASLVVTRLSDRGLGSNSDNIEKVGCSSSACKIVQHSQRRESREGG